MEHQQPHQQLERGHAEGIFSRLSGAAPELFKDRPEGVDYTSYNLGVIAAHNALRAIDKQVYPHSYPTDEAGQLQSSPSAHELLADAYALRYDLDLQEQREEIVGRAIDYDETLDASSIAIGIDRYIELISTPPQE